MKAGIAIDAWKLPIFKRHLREAGYGFTEGPGVTSGTLLLTVETDNMETLGWVVAAANQDARQSRDES